MKPLVIAQFPNIFTEEALRSLQTSASAASGSAACEEKVAATGAGAGTTGTTVADLLANLLTKPGGGASAAEEFATAATAAKVLDDAATTTEAGAADAHTLTKIQLEQRTRMLKMYLCDESLVLALHTFCKEVDLQSPTGWRMSTHLHAFIAAIKTANHDSSTPGTIGLESLLPSMLEALSQTFEDVWMAFGLLIQDFIFEAVGAGVIDITDEDTETCTAIFPTKEAMHTFLTLRVEFLQLAVLLLIGKSPDHLKDSNVKASQ